MRTVFANLVRLLLLLAPLLFSVVQNQFSTLHELQAATASSDNCQQLQQYIAEKLAADETLWEEFGAVPAFSGTNDSGHSISSLVDLLPLLNPTELERAVNIFDLHVGQLESLNAPLIAQNFHGNLIALYRLMANIVREIQTVGIALAYDVYEPLIQERIAEAVREAEEFEKICPEENGIVGLTSDLILQEPGLQTAANAVPTPQSEPGQAELKNVHDAIAEQGATVEYGRQTVRVEGLTPVGQQLMVEDVPVYVFIFEDPDSRAEQTGELTTETLEITTPSGADAATGELVVSQGSNVLTISDGAPDDVQAKIDAGVQTLP